LNAKFNWLISIRKGVALESSDRQNAEYTDSKENLQPISQERQAAIKEKLDKWCEEKTPQ
jgi:hypothetical protein